MTWLERYMDNRIRNIKQQNVKQNWRKASLERLINDKRQQDIENPE